MHPRWEVLEKMQKTHPWVRLGWWGQEDKGGKFSIIQLYHQQDALKTFVQPWNNRGPIYGKPFDPLVRVPMWIKDVETEDVFSGRIVSMLYYWMRPMRERVQESENEAWRDLDFRLKDLSEEAGDYVWHEAKKTGHTSSTMARKFIDKKDQNILSGDYDTDISSVVKTTAPEGAVAFR